MERSAPHHYSGPNEPAPPAVTVPAAAAPRATITSFFFRNSPLSGTTMSAPTPTVPQAPTTVTGRAPKAPTAAGFTIKYGTGSRFPISQQNGDFCCHPRVSNMGLILTAKAWEWKSTMVSDQFLVSRVITLLVITPPVNWPGSVHVP